MKKPAWLIALVPGVIVLLVGAWWVLSKDDSALSPLEEARQKIEDLGYILDPDELGRSLAVPPDENAAVIFQGLGARFGSEGEIGLLMDDEYPVERAFQYHTAHPGVYDELLRMAGMAGCDFGRDWHEGLNMRLPELGYAKGMTLYCALLARTHAERGDFDAALESLIVADRIGTHLGREPLFISVFVAFTCRTMVFRAATDIFNASGSSESAIDMLASITDVMRDLPPVNYFAQGEITTAVVSIPRYTLAEMMGAGAAGTPPGTGDKIDRPLLDAREQIFLERAVELVGILSSTDRATDVIDRLEEFETAVENDERLGAGYSQLVMSVYSSYYEDYAQLVALGRMFRQLDDIIRAGDMAQYDGDLYDPINGGEFVLVPEGDGFKLYSTGFDGIDDGGPDMIGYDIHNETNDDIGFWIEINDE